MKLTLRDLKGNSTGEYTVAFALIENGKGTQAVHDSVVAYRANQRMGTACTKTMGQVAGTGKKPWRQKGTGRARAGSFASPLWRGGGVVFGPKPRDFSQAIPRSTRRLALRKALSARLKAGDVTIVDDLKLDSAKTKALVGALAALNIEGNVLLVTGETDRGLMLAARNLRNVAVTTGSDLNTYDALRVDRIVFNRAAFEQVEKRLATEQA